MKTMSVLWFYSALRVILTVSKGLSEDVLIKRTESAIHNLILNNDRTIVSCVYEPLLQPSVLSLHSSQS